MVLKPLGQERNCVDKKPSYPRRRPGEGLRLTTSIWCALARGRVFTVITVMLASEKVIHLSLRFRNVMMDFHCPEGNSSDILCMIMETYRGNTVVEIMRTVFN